MTRCGVCQSKIVTDGGENCEDCDYALEDARLHPPTTPHIKTGVVISGYSDEEIITKRKALGFLKSTIAGRGKMTKAFFEQMCECVGIQFCYECGLKDVSMTDVVQKIIQDAGLQITAGPSQATLENQAVRAQLPYGGSDHAPFPYRPWIDNPFRHQEAMAALRITAATS